MSSESNPWIRKGYKDWLERKIEPLILDDLPIQLQKDFYNEYLKELKKTASTKKKNYKGFINTKKV